MSELVIAAILDDCEVGDTFQMWPLHVTILPPFEAEKSEKVVNSVMKLTLRTEQIQTQLGEFVKFGSKRIVRRLTINPELQALHDKLLQLAELNSWKVPQKYVGPHYTPHVTRKNGRDYDGNEFVIDYLYVVEAQPMGYRKIIAKLPLAGKN